MTVQKGCLREIGKGVFDEARRKRTGKGGKNLYLNLALEISAFFIVCSFISFF